MNEGSVFGWPYCLYDGKVNKMILAPEYGGDGTAIGRCAQSEAPVAGFPAHYAPVDLQFFTSTTLPAKYRSGAFIVMRGSWNRAPAPMAGYNVLCQPFEKCKPSGRYEASADGFAGKTPLMSPSDAAARPNGIALGPDGSLFITESVKGKTWRVFARGQQPSRGVGLAVLIASLDAMRFPWAGSDLPSTRSVNRRRWRRRRGRGGRERRPRCLRQCRPHNR